MIEGAFIDRSAARDTIVDVVTTRDPARNLPDVDSRTQVIKNCDRIA